MSEGDLVIRNKAPETGETVETGDGKPVLEATYRLPEEEFPDGGFIHFFIADPDESIEGDKIVAAKRIKASNEEKNVKAKSERKVGYGRKKWTCVLKNREEEDLLDSESGENEFIHKKLEEGDTEEGTGGEVAATPQIMEKLESLEERLERIEGKLSGSRPDDFEPVSKAPETEEGDVETFESREEEDMPSFEDVEYKDLECPECEEKFKTDIGLKVHRKVNHPESFEEGAS